MPHEGRSRAVDSSRDGEFTCLCLWGIGYELSNLVPDLVSHAAESFCFLFGQSTGGIWVDDTPVQNAEREGEYRIPFLGRITDCNHVTETFFQRLRDALRLLARDVDACFLHHFTYQGAGGASFDAYAHDIKSVTCEGTKKTLGDQAARGVASREK